MHTLLQLPWLGSGPRARLWEAQRRLSGRLTDAVLKQDAEEDAARRRLPEPPAVDPAGLTARERQQTLHRARVALGLLRLLGAADLKGLTDALASAAGGADDAWPVLSDQLRRAWDRAGAKAPDGPPGDAP
jgi:hypothetical protein